ncbi:hypothetical protein HKD37_14G039543 [Glycine soja]
MKRNTHSDKHLDIVNNVRLLGIDFSNDKIVQKILFIVPKKFEATIASLENSRDLSSMTLVELVKIGECTMCDHTLQTQEQRRLIRQEGYVEGVFQPKNYKGNKQPK